MKHHTLQWTYQEIASVNAVVRSLLGKLLCDVEWMCPLNFTCDAEHMCHTLPCLWNLSGPVSSLSHSFVCEKKILILLTILFCLKIVVSVTIILFHSSNVGHSDVLWDLPLHFSLSCCWHRTAPYFLEWLWLPSYIFRPCDFPHFLPYPILRISKLSTELLYWPSYIKCEQASLETFIGYIFIFMFQRFSKLCTCARKC